MDVVLEHLQEHYLVYVAVLVVALPLVYFTRKWSVPVILYTIEICIYMVIMHTAVFLLVMVTRWFKQESSMKALRPDGTPEDAPTWGTPYFEFWRRELYDPAWIVYVELAFILVIVLLVWRYRPMKIQRKGRRQAALERRKGKAPVRSAADPRRTPRR